MCSTYPALAYPELHQQVHSTNTASEELAEPDALDTMSKICRSMMLCLAGEYYILLGCLGAPKETTSYL